MPKKMGVNSKSVEARERKEATKKANQERAAKEAEDRMWEDEDKSLARKQKKREEEERKRAEAAKRKAESKALLDQEMSSIRTQNKHHPCSAKINRQQIMEEVEKKQKALEAMTVPKTTSRVVTSPIIEENLNRAMADVEVATNVDQALAMLSLKTDEEDKHPERRMRAAYRAFEAANLPRIKAENPNLRLSQWKQLLMKEWNKSPENPFNQAE
uniref:Coiled-coil domain-containing protein n=1 Tax=Glossina brevipalpis TaxID=37001 RepID=A0A1A9X1C3_9MUSC